MRLTAIKNCVDIELLIEGRRSLLFRKITQKYVDTNSALSMDSSSSVVEKSDSGSSYGSENVPKASNSSVSVGQDNPFIYTVTGSIWDESEGVKSEPKRVFKVKHLSDEYYYYAFTLRSYIVCPAFLARSLNIANYAFLNVIYDTNYPYIFIKEDIYNPNLNIAGDQFKFLGKHEFKLSFEPERVFNLTFENKDTMSFIWYNPGDPTSDEWEKVVKEFKSSETLYGNTKESELNQGYIYISKNRFKNFKKKHKAFVDLVPLYDSCPLILEESSSFSEIKEDSLMNYHLLKKDLRFLLDMHRVRVIFKT
jgi:hypothetical protein